MNLQADTLLLIDPSEKKLPQIQSKSLIQSILQQINIQMNQQQQASAILKCNTISKILSGIKQQLQTRELSKNPLTPFQISIKLRNLFRDIAIQVQAKRNLVQLKKEKIQKSKNYLEGLQYYKSMLQNKIEICNIELEDINEIVQQDLSKIDFAQNFNQTTSKLNDWLQGSKNKKIALSQKKSEKQLIQNSLRKKKKLYQQQLPIHLNKFQENLKNVMEIFQIPIVHQLHPIVNKKLLNLYNYFYPLADTKQIGLHYAQNSLNIQIDFTEESRQIKIANQSKINLEPKEIKFMILNLRLSQGEELIVLAVDRSCDYSNEQLFHRLINQQPIKPLFLKPENQQHRNHNTRYITFDWLNDITSGRNNLDLTNFQVIKKIKNRVISLQLTKIILENLKNNKFNFFFRLIKENELTSPPLKKYNFNIISKINNFQQFKEQIFIPQWLKLLLINPKENFKENTQNCNPAIESNNSLLKYFHLEEIISIKYYEIYKIVLTCHQNIITFLWLIPYSYPEKKPIIKVIEYTRKKDEKKSLEIFGNKTITINSFPEKNTTNINSSTSVINHLKILKIEEEVNNDLKQFLSPENQIFYMVYQMNRFMTVVEEIYNKEMYRESCISKLYDV